MNATNMTFEQLCELFGYSPTGRPLDTKQVAALLGKGTEMYHRKPRRMTEGGTALRCAA